MCSGEMYLPCYHLYWGCCVLVMFVCLDFNKVFGGGLSWHSDEPNGVIVSEGWWEAGYPQGNQELLVVRDKVGRLPGQLGVSKFMECDIFPFNALTLPVGGRGRASGLTRERERERERWTKCCFWPGSPLVQFTASYWWHSRRHWSRCVAEFPDDE